MDLRQIAERLGGSILPDDYRGNFTLIESTILLGSQLAQRRSVAQQCDAKFLYAAFSILRGDLCKADELLKELLDAGNGGTDAFFHHRCQAYTFYLSSLKEVPAILRFRGLLENTAALIANAPLNIIEHLKELEDQRKLMLEKGAGDSEILENRLFAALHTYNTELQIYCYSHPEHWANHLRLGIEEGRNGQDVRQVQIDVFPNDLRSQLKQLVLPKTEASLVRLSAQLQFAVNPASATNLSENFRRDQYDDRHSYALLCMLRGDAILSPPFTSPIALNLIALTQGPGWTHERWDDLETHFPLRYNRDAWELYLEALNETSENQSPRLRAAVKLRLASLLHMQGLNAFTNDFPGALAIWDFADQNLKDARVGFYGDYANLLVVDAHLFLLKASRNEFDTVGDAVSKCVQLGRDAHDRGNVGIAQFIGCLILRYARWRFVTHRRSDIANVCCAAACALFATCQDPYMEMQSLIAHADLLEQCRDLEGAQLKVDDACVRGGVVDRAMQHFGRVIRAAKNTDVLRQARKNALDHFDRIASRVYQAIGRSDLLRQWREKKQNLEKVFSPPTLPPRPATAHSGPSPPPLPPRREASSRSSDTALPRIQDLSLRKRARRSGGFQSTSVSQAPKQHPVSRPSINPRGLIQQIMDSAALVQQHLANAVTPMQTTQQLLGIYDQTIDECYILIDKAELKKWRSNILNFIVRCDRSPQVPENMTALYKLICYTHLGELDQARALLPRALPREFGGTGAETVLDQFRPFAFAAGMQAFLPRWQAQSAERAISFAVLAQDWANGSQILDQVVRDLPNFATPEGLPAETETWQLVSWVGAIHEHAGRPDDAFAWYLNALCRLEGLRNAADIEARRNCHSTIHSSEIYAALVRLCLRYAKLSAEQSGSGAITHRDPRDWALGEGRSWIDQALIFLEQSRARTLLDILVTKQKIDPRELSRWQLRQFLVTASITLQQQDLPQGMREEELSQRLRQLTGRDVTALEIRQALREARELFDMEQKAAVSMYNLTPKEVEATVLYKCIPKDAIVIQILPSRKGTSILCISNKGVEAVNHTDLTDIELRTLVLPYVKKAKKEKSSKEKLKTLACAISQLILTPFETQVRRSRTIIFVHSHALQVFPCASYILDEQPLFLQKIVYQVPSLSVLYQLKRVTRQKPCKKISAMVSSTAAGDEFQADGSGETDGRLFLIAAEGTAIASAFNSKPVDLDDQQQLNFPSNLLQDSSIVWIATHGEAVHASPWQSYLHARQRFRVLDMAALNRCAPLVVFTACWAGLGNATVGNDILGFAHAVLASGSQVFIAGLWKLNETVSMLLMVLFFRKVAANSDHETVGELWRRALVDLYNMEPEPAQELIRDVQEAWQAANQHSLVLKGFEKDEVDGKLEWLIDEIVFADLDFQHPVHWATYNLVGDGELVL